MSASGHDPESSSPNLDPQLNPPQREAVLSVEGPLLILAGAGSGKTRVLTFRVAEIIRRGLASPGEILAVTFTNKAAREMEHRIYQLLERAQVFVREPMWINTFHSTCVRILRDQIHLLGYKPFFVIYDDSDQLGMVKKVLTDLNINEKMYPAKTFKNRINEAKMLAQTPEDFQSRPSALMDEQSLKVYTEYEKQMTKANALDFGDLLMKTYDLFRMYPDILSMYQKLFKFVLVDEYQDTNKIQYLIIRMLADSHKNICVVGDEDQSIYSWRGADISNILNFEKDFPDCKVIKLEENYRSSQTIVDAATHLIKNNSQRMSKTLFTNNAAGHPIVIHEELNEYEEARYVVKQTEGFLRESQWAYSDFAIFYRTNSQSRVLEDQLRSHGLPYRIVGGIKFYERKEIKDALSYLRLILNATDDMAFARILNVPARGIGKTTLEKIEDVARTEKLSFMETLKWMMKEKSVHQGALKKLSEFLNLIQTLQELSAKLTPSALYREVLIRTQYIEKLKLENTPESLSRIDNLEEFNNAISQFEQERGKEASLQSFLEEMALVSDLDKMKDQENSITLMTLHISKGLEFPVVFIVGMEEGLFPGVQTIESHDPFEIEEERRLAYVGITRAREYLFLTHARSRRVWGQEHHHPPSRFLKEIPEKLVKFESSIQRPQFADSFRQHMKPTPSKAYDDFSDDLPKYEDYVDENAGSYFAGMRVRHPIFGIGSIHQVEGSGDEQKVSVLFPGNRLKKFVTKYARLERA